MIFVTVGTQLPFPRLIDHLNVRAPDLDEPIIAQTGVSTGNWPNLDIRATLKPDEYADTVRSARVIVAHAGIGTVLSAKQYQKPLIVMPRQFALGEHRNDHQMATARQIDGMPGIHVAWDTGDLDRFLDHSPLQAASHAVSPAHDALLSRLRSFIGPA